jgi:hypothetical protein
LLLADDRLQHVSGLGDVREINLGLDFVGSGLRGARTLRSGAFAGAAEIDTDLLRFMVFQGTGMRLLLGYADVRQRIENRFAFDFQLSGQIVNSNLAHPPLCSSELSR